MRAARYYGAKDVRIEQTPAPDYSRPEWRDHVLVEVEWCGICGSDLHLYLAGPTAPPTMDTPHPLTGSKLPTTLGHECCGVVKQVPQDSTFQVGDRVFINPTLTCEECFSCQKGWKSQCNILGFLGQSGGGGGGLSEVIAVAEHKLHKIPPTISMDHAALAEPLAVGLHAIRKAETSDDQWGKKSVLILGGGPVGYAVAANLLALGADASRIFVSEPTKKRQSMLQKLGVRVVDPGLEDVVRVCQRSDSGVGVDFVFDCAGVAASISAGLPALRAGGTYINLALWGRQITIPFLDFFKKELTLRCSMAYNSEDIQDALDLMAEGKYPHLGDMVTARILLEDVVDQGLEELIRNKHAHIKIIVTPKASNLVGSRI